MPGRLQVQVKTSFGQIVLEGESPIEIFKLLEDMPPEFVEKIENLVDAKLTPVLQTHLEGIVEFTTDGPVVTAKEKMTHYEAIGLVLYASEGKESTAATVDRLLQSSGVKPMVPARLNEMTKRGLVFKPNPRQPEFRLTTQGETWVREKVISRLRETA